MTSINWHHLDVTATLTRLQTSGDGLTSSEAARRLGRTGRNEIARRKSTPAWRLLVKQFANFFVSVLLFAAALAYAISFVPNEESRRLTSFFILGIVALTVLLSFFEEYRSQKELEALDKLLVFKAVVKRGFDILVAGTCVLLLSPVFIVVALATKIESRGPILCKQKRSLTDQDEPFDFFKFRSMVLEADEIKDSLMH